MKSWQTGLYVVPFHIVHVSASRLHTRFTLNEGSSSSIPPVLKLPSSTMEPAITTTTTSNTSNDLLDDSSYTHKMSIKGVVLISRNGDRTECYQDPKTYKYGPTGSTPLGEARIPSLCIFRYSFLTRSFSIKPTHWELSFVTPTSLGVVTPRSPGSPPTLRTFNRFTSV